jgi:hypothetical protein
MGPVELADSDEILEEILEAEFRYKLLMFLSETEETEPVWDFLRSIASQLFKCKQVVQCRDMIGMSSRFPTLRYARPTTISVLFNLYCFSSSIAYNSETHERDALIFVSDAENFLRRVRDFDDLDISVLASELRLTCFGLYAIDRLEH